MGDVVPVQLYVPSRLRWDLGVPTAGCASGVPLPVPLPVVRLGEDGFMNLDHLEVRAGLLLQRYDGCCTESYNHVHGVHAPHDSRMTRA